jgi:hypothetical protein
LNYFSEQMRAFRDHFESIEKTLGRNFLGVAAWKNVGVAVGEPPPWPDVTLEFLNSECPLHPGQKIKDTHILALIPKAVNGEPYSVRTLDRLSATWSGSGDSLINASGYESWESQDWAKAPRAHSEWILIPKIDPDPKVSQTYFRGRNVETQQKVLEDHYKEYRGAKALEVMTVALLYYCTHQERLLARLQLRCDEPNSEGDRVNVGYFGGAGGAYGGLKLLDGWGGRGRISVGLAIARKL